MSLLKCTKPRGELVVIQPTALRQAGPGGVQEALCQYEATFPGAQSCAAETLQELEKSLYKYAYYASTYVTFAIANIRISSTNYILLSQLPKDDQTSDCSLVLQITCSLFPSLYK